MSKLKTTGNETTMNLNQILYQNIIAAPYFKSLYEKKTYHEILDEIYNNVTSLEPFFKGTTPSSAFCLLYKLWTLRLTVKQIEGLIDNRDSPHTRAIGFLYLRYVADFAVLWDWFGDYLDDDEEVRIEGGARPRVSTIGKVCRDLLTEQKWLGTILPRIPVLVQKDLEAKIKEIDGASSVATRPPPPQVYPSQKSRSPDASRYDGKRAPSEDLDYGDEPSSRSGGGRGGRVDYDDRRDGRRDDYSRRDDFHRRDYDRRDDYGTRGAREEYRHPPEGRRGSRDRERGYYDDRKRSPPSAPYRGSHHGDSRRRSPSPQQRREYERRESGGGRGERR